MKRAPTLSGTKRWGRGERGSILMVVLITVLFASFALAVFIDRASNDLLAESRVITAASMRLEACSALETTLAVLEEFRQVNGSLKSPAEGWSDPLAFAGYEPTEGRTIEVLFQDESGKFSLPNVTQATLVNVFEGWQLSQPDAEKLADALLGWMKKDYVAGSASAPQAGDYETGSLPFSPPGRSLRSFDELATIGYARDVFYDENGLPNELWHRFVNAFSLYSYTEPNINGANPDLLAGLGALDASAQKRLDDYLAGSGAYESQGSGYFKNVEDVGMVIGQAPSGSVGTQIRALRVILIVHEGQNSYRLNALIAPQGGAKVPQRQEAGGTQSNNATATREQTRPNATSSRSATSTQAPRLNYPFTILEFRENDEIASPVTPPPAS